jgi:hypothetical protein
MEVSDLLHAPAALPPGKEPPDNHWIGGWVGPRAGLDAVAKRKNPVIASAGNLTLVFKPIAQSRMFVIMSQKVL